MIGPKGFSLIIMALLQALFLIPPVLAQTSLTGSISGRVIDADSTSRAGLAGATLILTNQETNIRRTVLTRKGGSYSFDLLPPSRYRLSCELKGYESLSGLQQNIEVYIATQKELRVPPFAMRKMARARTTQPPSTIPPSRTASGRVPGRLGTLSLSQCWEVQGAFEGPPHPACRPPSPPAGARAENERYIHPLPQRGRGWPTGRVRGW